MVIKSRKVKIVDDVIVGRIYLLFNSVDQYIYVGSTTLPLTKRLGDHMYSYNQNIDTPIYNHMRKIGLEKWTVKLLDIKFVNSKSELFSLEQTWINRFNPAHLLNFKNAITEEKSLNVKKEAQQIVTAVLNDLIEDIVGKLSQTQITNSNEEEI
jgi:group I intron endonuclease